MKKSNRTTKTKQKFPPSNTDMANKGDSHVSVNPLMLNKELLLYSQDRRPIKEVVDQYTEPSVNGTKSNKQIADQPVESSIDISKNNQEYSASNKKDPVRPVENRHFITPEASSVPQQDVALTEEMLTSVNKELADLSDRKIPIKIKGVDFYTKGLLALLHLNENGWLTDNVIMAYMKMIENRSKKDKKLPKVYIFDSLFSKDLLTKKYSEMQSWTKTDLSSYKKVIIPIHLGDHWCLAVIDLPEKPEYAFSTVAENVFFLVFY